jgi:ferredoxin-NADP reductase
VAFYTVKLVKKQTVARGTMAFHFEKPEGFTYRAGQFGDWSLINPPETDDRGNSREFSLASAPYEPDLMIATRMRDTAFKRVLGGLALGAEIKLEGPFGDFTLHQTVTTPAVYLTGGIGATLVRSITTQAAQDRLDQKITLFYSNRAPQDAAFLEHFEALAAANKNFEFVPTMTQLEGQAWSGETGYINREMLAKHLPDMYSPIYYLSGPEPMVAAMRQMLREAHVNEDNIRSEEFPGY